jgi:hypothetical protein
MTAVDLLTDRPSDRALHALARVQGECAASWPGTDHICRCEDTAPCPHDDHTVGPDGQRHLPPVRAAPDGRPAAGRGGRGRAVNGKGTYGLWVEDEFGDWLHQCGSCDAGLPMDCTCPPSDPRSVILALVERLDAVVKLHRQTSEVGLADGAWCPADGEE